MMFESTESGKTFWPIKVIRQRNKIYMKAGVYFFVLMNLIYKK